MKLSAIALSVIALALSLCGACSTLTTSHLLDNLQGCTRHYDGAVAAGMTGGQFSGTVKVDCEPPGGTPAPKTQAAQPTPVAPPA